MSCWMARSRCPRQPGCLLAVTHTAWDARSQHASEHHEHRACAMRTCHGMNSHCIGMQDPNELLNEYGADALRLYLINSPVVRGETLRFKKEGVFAVVKDVFLPWYNAYRFLVQNVLRLQQQQGITFQPTQVNSSQPTPLSPFCSCLCFCG